MTEVAPHPGHILLVVCQASDRQVLAAMLREGGYRVTSVAPGPEALQALGEAAPDLVVLGVGAPGEEGYELCTQILTGEEAPHVPVLLAGVSGDPRARARAFAAGAAEVLTRPFQREEVLARVGAHVALAALQRRLAEAEARLEQIDRERQALQQQRDAADEALRDAEARGRDLVENLNEVIFTADREGVLNYVSPSVQGLLGYEPDAMVGCHVREFVHPDDLDGLQESLARVLAGQRVANEYRLLAHAGELRWVRTSSQPAYDEEQLAGVQGVLVDITEHKEAEEQIRQQNEFLHRILESLTHPFYVVDAQDYSVQMANSAARVEARSGRATCYALTHDRTVPCSADEHPCPVEEIKRTKRPVTVEHVHRDPEGQVRHVEVHGYPLFDAEGDVARVIEYTLDITDRKRMEAQLRWELAVSEALSVLYRPLSAPASSIEEIAEVVLDWARALTASEHGYVSSIDPDSGDLLSHTLTEMLGGACQIVEDQSCIIFPRGSDGRYAGLWGASLNSRQAFYENDVPSHPASTGTPKGHIPLERFLSVPVVLGDELVGQIALANSERDYGEQDLDAVRRLAEFYALAIQRKRVQEALRHERDVVSAILDTAGALVVVLDAEGQIVRFNRACEQTTGYSFDEVEGVPFWDLLLIPEEVEPVQGVFAELRAGQFPNEFENYWRTKDGRRRLIAWSNTALLDERGAVEYVVGTGIDITERRRAEEALRESERKYRQLIEVAQEGVWVIDADNKTTLVNPRMAEMLGYRVEEMLGRHLFSFMNQRGVEITERNLERRRRGIREQHDFELLHKDGSRVYTSMETSPITDESGAYVGALAMVADITDRRQAEQALRESEARWRSVTEDSPDHIVLLDRDLKIEYVNYPSPGLTVEELIGTPLYTYVAEERQPEIRALLERVLQTAEPARYETEYNAEDGTTVYYESSAVPRVLDEQVIGLAVSARDVSELKRAERAAREASQVAEEARRDEERRRRIADGLASVLAALNTNQPLDRVLTQIAEQGGRLLDSEAVAICGPDEGEGGLAVRASYGLAGQDLDTGVPLGRQALGQAMTVRQALVIRDLDGRRGVAGEGLEREDQAGGAQHRALLAVPVEIQDEAFGGLLLYRDEPRAFSRDDVELATTLGDQVALAVQNARLRDQIEEAAAAAERGRLARDLHDSVTQALFSATLVAEVLPQVWQRNPEEALEGVQELRQLTRAALAEMRTMLLELRPTALVETRLDDLLRQLIEAVTSRVQLPVSRDISAVPPMPPEVHVTFYRVAQEALQNVVKHAEAQEASVYLGATPPYDPQAENGWEGQVVLRVRDDGRGFDEREAGPDQLGLSIMRERAESVGAVLTIETQPGGGSEVTLVWDKV